MTDATALTALGFHEANVRVRRLDIDHPSPVGLGPFCRLDVDDDAPCSPGVYSWTVDGAVAYVGRARELRQITHGYLMTRAYNDYTYIPPSQAAADAGTRVRINGLLNGALTGGRDVAWWWLELDGEADAQEHEAELIAAWDPEWNIAQPAPRRSA